MRIDKFMLNKLFTMTQPEVKHYAKKILKREGYTPILKDGFLYAKGNLPIVLLAHMDTVHRTPKRVFISETLDMASSTTGLGADDRAGVYAILNLVQQGYRPTVLLLEDEEIGGVGADKFIEAGINLDASYLIELDRQGKDDCVFYDLWNNDFIKFIEAYGFKEDWGSFSDISTIAPYFNIGAVNLSVGYYKQHTAYEYLVLSELADTIDKVKVMLETAPEVKFVYDVGGRPKRADRWSYLYGYGTYKYDKKSKTVTTYYGNKYDWDDWCGEYDEKVYEGLHPTEDDVEDEDDCPFEYDDDYYELKDKEKWYNTCEASILVPLRDCIVNLPSNDIIDTGFTSDYLIGNNNKIYHTVTGLVKDAVALSYDWYEISYDDVVNKMTYRDYLDQMDEDDYYYGKGAYMQK